MPKPHLKNGDYICPKCKEPWDKVGVDDMTDMDKDEAKKFLNGDGCPCCTPHQEEDQAYPGDEVEEMCT